MNTSRSLRRSPVHDCLEELKPVWAEIHNMNVPLRFKEAASEAQLKTELSLCDLSCLPKMSVKGPGSLAWMAQAGILVPESVYGCRSMADRGLVIRTDRQEVFLEDGPASHMVSEVERELSSHPLGVYLVRRQDASFQLTGVRSNAVLRETCGVDFSNPQDGVVMTRVAGVSCMVLPLQAEAPPAFRFWLDPSYGSYFWDALLEIVRDQGGDAIGFEALYPLFTQANSVKGEIHDS
jgi:sarcosine oxidase, subunit gamma